MFEVYEYFIDFTSLKYFYYKLVPFKCIKYTIVDIIIATYLKNIKSSMELVNPI